MQHPTRKRSAAGWKRFYESTRKFSNDSLKISRSTSTNVYPCEINAKVDADVFDNAWLPLYSGTWLMTTTVNSGGTMTLTWN